MHAKGKRQESRYFWGILCLIVTSPSLVMAAAMPVKEVTIFKDGHVFMLHEGRMPIEADGNVSLDRLPTPLMGTFWAYSADDRATLTSVVSGQRSLPLKRTSLSVRSLLAANVGARVRITEIDQQAYAATVLAIPTRSVEELRRTGSDDVEIVLPQVGEIVLLETEEGVKAVPLGRIQDVTFVDSPDLEVTEWEVRPSLTYRLNWGNRAKGAAAEVGMTYVQRGIRWIPSYRVNLDGQGRAKIQLQATLINELVDLDDVTAHLVVGVPSFAFEDTADPISLRQAAAQVSSQMRPDSRTAMSFSNSIMSQVAIAPEPVMSMSSAGPLDLGPGIDAAGKNEDLYVFELEHVSLSKGGRMVISLAEYELDYRDLYVVDLPFAPPPEVRRNFNSRQQEELARRLTGPKATHVVRLDNTADCPLTTAPALILREGRIIAQNMMTYTPTGGACDLELTTAVDVSVTLTDIETDRVPNAVQLDSFTYARTDYAGTIAVMNRLSDTVELEVRRSILGQLDEAGQDGKTQQLAGNDGTWLTRYGTPFWWEWSSWPYWWYHLNGFGRATWTRTLHPGERVELTYEWHYFWRQ